MPSINGQEFISVPRLFVRAVQSVKNMERDGIDGSAWKKQGQRNNLTTVICVIDRDDDTDLSTLELAMFALQGGPVITVIDDIGRSWTNIFVAQVVPADAPKKGGLAVGGTTAGSVVARFAFTFQDRDLV